MKTISAQTPLLRWFQLLIPFFNLLHISLKFSYNLGNVTFLVVTWFDYVDQRVCCFAFGFQNKFLACINAIWSHRLSSLGHT